jgi:hypothetical protein
MKDGTRLILGGALRVNFGIEYKLSNWRVTLVLYPSQELASTRIKWLVCGLPKPLRQERLILMLQGYFDDSGSDGTRPPFVLAGFILPAERWETFSDEWQAECFAEPRIEYFKMREANGGNGQFSFSSEFRKFKVRRLAALIDKHILHGINTWLRWDEFREFDDGLIGPAKHQPYAPLFFGILDNVAAYQIAQGIYPSKIQVDFDNQGTAGVFAIQSYGEMIEVCERQNIELDFRKIMEGTPRMLDDKKYPGLQAADMLAWCIRFQLDNSDWQESEWAWLCNDLNKTIWKGCMRYGKPNWDEIKGLLLQRGRPVTPPQS